MWVQVLFIIWFCSLPPGKDYIYANTNFVSLKNNSLFAKPFQVWQGLPSNRKSISFYLPSSHAPMICSSFFKLHRGGKVGRGSVFPFHCPWFRF